MNKIIFSFLIVILILLVFSNYFIFNYVDGFLAKAWIENSVAIKQQTVHYNELASSKKDNLSNNSKIKIMVVPGHDDKYSGAIYGDITEADMNLQVAENLKKFLEKEKGIKVTLIRDKDGYNEDFLNYMTTSGEEIKDFYESATVKMDELIKSGKLKTYSQVQHNFAPTEVRHTLYSINKYVNENDFDIVLHIHFNDYPGRSGSGGKYSGFSIYAPEKQYSNSKDSMEFAKNLYNQFSLWFPVSNLKGESTGIVPTQDLIAIGSKNTVEAAAVLLEFGYIYENRFHNLTKELIFEELAFQTYKGIINYLNKQDEQQKTTSLDYNKILNELFGESFDSSIARRQVMYDYYTDDRNDEGVLALQLYLREKGLYPVYGPSDMNNCPIDGVFGICTKAALDLFLLR